MRSHLIVTRIIVLVVLGCFFSFCKEDFQILCSSEFETSTIRKDITILTNYQEALFCAKEYDVPLLIYFTGYGSYGSRRPQDIFFDEFLSNTSIRKLIKEHFILVALYVDDATIIKKEDLSFIDDWMQKKEIKNQHRKIRNLGNLNSQIQIGLVGKNTQPYYLMIDKDENAIIEGFGYTKTINNFRSKLYEAISLIENK